MSRLFDLKLRVSDRKLTTILDVINGAAELLSITPVADAVRPAPLKKRYAYVGGHARKNVKGVELVLVAAQSGSSKPALRSEFRRNGFADKSMSAAVSNARRDGLIKYTDGGGFVLTPKGGAALSLIHKQAAAPGAAGAS